MCGITAVFNPAGISSAYLKKANRVIAHRGPDDEGFLLWKPGEAVQSFSGPDTALATHQAFGYPALPDDRADWKVGLGHRRLSIIDLSPMGHQPMELVSRGLVIVFNGEVFNYIEIRTDLEKLGHRFQTGSDTEVILHAWQEWGKEALHRFNGMFAFILLDSQLQKLYAVRDRFGVKPLYYTSTPSYTAFASEVKQLRTLPEYQFKLNGQIAYDYLRYALIDHAEETFDEGIHQLSPGHLLELDIRTGVLKKTAWYTLNPVRWTGTEEEACERFYELLKDSVMLRMRADVPVGSALSGGLDSSTVVCLMRQVLNDQGVGNHPIRTITSCQEDKRFDEWEYAEEVIRHMGAESFKVFPTFEKLQHDLAKMMWHMDYPFGSTSQFSQWCVFEGAKKQGLTVMIDGQGADEQLAGYGGNDMALYTGLLKRLNVVELTQEVKSYHRYKGHWPTGFLIGAVQNLMPAGLTKLIPEKYLVSKNNPPVWIRQEPYRSMGITPGSLRESLYHQVTRQPLPSLLRYEDRNSMAFSIESRVPFMDYRLIEFTLGLPESLVYRRGERKYILRKSFRGEVPDKILDRKDKMGFLSAEERWIKEEGKEWFAQALENVPEGNYLIDVDQTKHMFSQIQRGEAQFNFDPWRVINLNLFLKSQQKPERVFSK